jgi:Fur family zinc uptake transcriptional regulator
MHDIPAAFERGHDHDQCVRDALEAAINHCRKEGARLTPLRRKVLQAVWRSHVPLGAYEICHDLVGQGERVLPPTIYRALEFLENNGLVHRIASRNAFIGCNQPGAHHHGRYLICSDCGLVAELPADGHMDALIGEASALNFTARSVRLEAIGLCAACALGRGGAA